MRHCAREVLAFVAVRILVLAHRRRKGRGRQMMSLLGMHRRHVGREGGDAVVSWNAVIALAVIIIIGVIHASSEALIRVIIIHFVVLHLFLRPTARFARLNGLLHLRTADRHATDVLHLLPPRLVLVVGMIHFMVESKVLGELDKGPLVGVLQVP